MNKLKINCTKRLTYILLTALLFLLACIPKGTTDTEIVTVDKEFKTLFYTDSGGITGADGIFSVVLPDGSSVFLLGDCFLGKIENGARDYNTTMLRNAFNVINKEQTSTKAIYRGEYDNPKTLMEPVNESGDSTYRWYWPGHGFVRNDTLYIFALNLYNEPSAKIEVGKDQDDQDKVDKLTEDMFAFRISQIDLLSFTLPDFKHIETHKAPFDYSVNKIDLGNCVMVDGDYIYIYGTENLPGFSKVHVARVPFNSKNFHENWEYSIGNRWDADINKSKPIEIDVSVSEQFSIFKYKDQYILLTQERAGEDIFTYVSDFPNKDFKNKTFIYHTPDADLDSTNRIFSYNALAHVQYIKNNELLVSYCVNSSRVRDVFEDVENYRARFLRVPINLILNKEEKRH